MSQIINIWWRLEIVFSINWMRCYYHNVIVKGVRFASMTYSLPFVIELQFVLDICLYADIIIKG